MNHTTNYALSQWEPGDPVQRADFNADNAKIDAALAAFPYVFLRSARLEEEANRLDLDVSGIDCTAFHRLDLFISRPNPVGPWILRVNDSTKYRHQRSCDSIARAGTINCLALAQTPPRLTPAFSLTLCQPGAGVPVGCTFVYSYFEAVEGNCLMGSTISEEVTWDTLTSFNLLQYPSGPLLPAGTTLTLCGVRK